MSKRTPSPLGSLATGAVTALALTVQTGLAAVVGVVIARKFGRTEETDGFFAAYGVFVVLALAATSARVVVLPRLARARDDGRLAAETAAYGAALGIIALPLVLIGMIFTDQAAAVLTGFGPNGARQAAAETLPWIVVAAVGQFYAGLCASALASLDDYVRSAIGFSLGSVLGLLLILARIDEDGIVAVGWGIALNAAIAAAFPAVSLARRAWRERMPARGIATGSLRLGTRIVELARGATVPLALQTVYLVSLVFAGRVGVGAATSFGYAFLLGSAFVAVTAGSLGLVTAVPVTREGLDPRGVARHVDSASWVALMGVAAVTGVFAVAGGELIRAVLGAAYGAPESSELGYLVVWFAPYMIASVGVSVTFPLVFVQDRLRRLPLYSVALVVLHVPIAAIAGALGGLEGLALALAFSTSVGLVALLVDLRALLLTLRGLLAALATAVSLALASFLPSDLLLLPVPAAMLGLSLFVLLIALLRPAGLFRSWRYLRALG